jgi:hypothetical protein
MRLGWCSVVTRSALLGIILAALLVACGGGGNGPGDGGDAGDGDGGGGDGQARWVKPDGYASVTFFVDDTANQTYSSGALEWKGSFVYDEQTNIITFDASWGAEQGPYPPLYDDGPISEGGHEMVGAVAGDHIFSAEVYVKASGSGDQEFQYGVINEFDNWIWEGPNGKFVLPRDSTERIAAPGYFIHAFGTYDLIVKLDTAQLNSGFLPFDPAVDKIYLKGTMNSWDKRQLLDNGQKGDAAAGDGIYTYHHAENLGPHDGLLYAGQHVQFVFLIGDLEYKRGDALSDGVSASTNCDGPTDFAEVPVFLEPESRGKIKNTTVIVCEGGGGVALNSVVPSSGPPEGGTAVSVYGNGFVAGARVSFGGTDATGVAVKSDTQIDCVTPAHETGAVTVRVTNPDGSFAELASGFSFGSGERPEILFVEPGMGPTSGGTRVKITGRRFAQGATVSFGGAAATGVAFTSPVEISCTTPAHAIGKVAVTVTNPGNLSATFPDGFEYVEGGVLRLERVSPAFGSTKGGDTVTVLGSGFASGAQVEFGGIAATAIVVQNAGSIQCQTPAHAEGSVSVRVINPDLQEATLPNGFSYQKPAVDWAILQYPLSLALTAGEASPPIYCRVYESGVTEGAGPGAGILAQAGFGPAGSDPAGGGWSFSDMSFNSGCGDCGNNDEYQGQITIANPGAYDYACRFSMDSGDTWVVADGNGTTDGYSSANAGKASVETAGAFRVRSVTPPAGTILGGTPLTVSGDGFESGAAVQIDGQALSTTFVDAHTLRATTPAHAPGAVTVAVKNPSNDTAELANGFSYVLRLAAGRPVIDGAIDTASGTDWAAPFLAGENAAGSNWGENFADRLYLAFDDTNLYLGIAGKVEPANALVAYLDVDFGTQTGVRDMNTLFDNDSTLDNTVSSICNASAAGFGAEFAAGSKGMSSVEGGMVAGAGLRRIAAPASPGDFWWVDGAIVKCGSEAVEMALPWQSLLGGPLPSGGRQLSLFVRLLNQDGQYRSNDTLPEDSADTGGPTGQSCNVSRVFVFEAR